jgi:hypothetical protein
MADTIQACKYQNSMLTLGRERMVVANNTNGNGKWSTAAWEKRQKALELRKAGKTYNQIGAELSCSPQVAGRYVRTALHESIREPIAEVRELDLNQA